MISEEGIERPDFDSIRQTNVYGAEFWSARDLAPLLGYTSWRNFDIAISRAKATCEQSSQSIVDHFVGAIKPITGGKGATQNVKDYHLSRYACYLIAINGDPRKPEIAAAQTYFVATTRTFEMHQIRKEQEERLEMRLKVSQSYKLLANAAKGAGVQSETFGIFIDAGYLGLHRHTVQGLKDKKGISNEEDYLDRIGREELSAIDFKNVQAEKKLVRDNVSGLDDASQTHYFVGDQIRKTIETINGPMPEDLPSATSIRKMIEEYNRKRKRNAKTKIDEADTLF